MIDDVEAGTGDPSPAGLADVAWLRAVVSGDAPAVQRLVDEVGPVVYGFLFARVGGDESAAADLLQETFLEAIRSAHGYRGESAASTWICAIARRRLARHYEGERRREVARKGFVLVRSDAERAGGSTDASDLVNARDAVVRALGTLPPLHRQVLVLKYLDERSVEEIAKDLGKTRVQVQSLLQRARAGLRDALERSDD